MANSAGGFRFGPFRYDRHHDMLWRNGEHVPLGSKATRLLAMLLERAPAIATKAELMEAVWEGLAVEEGNLTVQVSFLRRALGPESWIATIPTRGYRFLADVSIEASNADEPIQAGQLDSGIKPPSGSMAPMVAVLPFANFSRDPRWDRFCNGLVEDVITDLARYPDLRVIARESSFAYRGRAIDLRQIGRSLDARYLVEGSLQAGEGHLKVTAQLIDAVSGAHVWAEQYSRDESDLFAIQGDIVGHIVAALTGLSGAILRAELTRVRRKPPASLEAYEMYLLGYQQEARFDREGSLRSIELSTEVTRIDPHFSRAWTVLAWALGNAAANGWVEDVDLARARQREARLKAAELDPHDSFALIGLSGVRSSDGDYTGAREALEHALELGSNQADVLALVAWRVSVILDRTAEAMNLMERAFTLNPHAPAFYYENYLTVCYFAGRFEDVVDLSARAPPTRARQLFLLLALARLDRLAEAEAVRRQLLVDDPKLDVLRVEAEPLSPCALEVLVEGARRAGLAQSWRP